MTGHGDGTFDSPVDLDLPASLQQARFTAADLNGDGAPDLAAVATMARELTLLFNTRR